MFQHLASCIHRYCTHDLKEPLDVAIALESCWIATISGKIGRYILTVSLSYVCQLHNMLEMHVLTILVYSY